MLTEPVRLGQASHESGADPPAIAARSPRRAVAYGLAAGAWVLALYAALALGLVPAAHAPLVGLLGGGLLVGASAWLLHRILHQQQRQQDALTRARRKAGARHRATRQLLEAIVSRSSDAIFAKDLQGRYLLMNPQALQALGRTEQEVVGHTDDVLYPPDAVRRIQASDQQVLQQGSVVESEHSLQGPRGRLLFLVLKAPLVDAQGTVVGLFGIARDITERRRVELALRDSEARYRAMTEQSPDAIVVHRAGRILYANPAALRMAGVATMEQALGQRVLDFAPVDSRDEIGRLTRELFTSRNGWEVVEVQVRRSDGSVIDVAVRGAAIEFDGAPAVQIVMRDISGRKRAQRELQARGQQLQEALAEREALLHEVHHRVKNNLQVIDSLLRMETRRNPQGEMQAVLQDMQGRIRAMAQLHEVLVGSRVVSGVDLKAYLGPLASRTVQAHARPQATVRLALDLVPVRVTLDQATPCGLLVNELLSNSLRHGLLQGGEVRLSLRPDGEDGHFLLEVRDDGVGLPADFATRKQQALGLQLADELAQQMGGQLVTGPGPAAVFTLHFRARLAPSAP